MAAETGSRALQADADALARRLQLVSGAVQALADLGEARQVARAKAQNTKGKIYDMKQVCMRQCFGLHDNKRKSLVKLLVARIMRYN